MKGFTLIELMITVAVIAVLTTIGVVTVSRILMQARDAKRASIMHDVQVALGLYNIRNQQYPNSPNDFCGTLNILLTGSYLDVAPSDPRAQSGLCLASGNPSIGKAMYVYTATPAAGSAESYVLTLVKESGGRADFYSPQ